MYKSRECDVKNKILLLTHLSIVSNCIQYVNFGVYLFFNKIKIMNICYCLQYHFQNVPCDLITGEERRHHFGPDRPAAHVSCTVEMTSTTTECK